VETIDKKSSLLGLRKPFATGGQGWAALTELSDNNMAGQSGNALKTTIVTILKFHILSSTGPNFGRDVYVVRANNFHFGCCQNFGKKHHFLFLYFQNKVFFV
jgi:hypothetical protein